MSGKHTGVALLIVSWCASYACHTLPAQSTNPNPPRFDPTRGSVLNVANGKVLWVNRNVIVPNARSDIRFEYVVEDLNDDDARHTVAEHKSLTGLVGGLPLGDATALMITGGGLDDGPGLTKFPINQSSSTVEVQHGSGFGLGGVARTVVRPNQLLRYREESLRLLYLGADGAIAQPTRWSGDRDRLAPLYWIPIDKDRLDLDAVIRLTDSDDEGSIDVRGFVRYKSQIAWLDATRMSRWLDEPLRRPPTLFVFDIAHKSVKKVVVRGIPLGEGTTLPPGGFDGESVLCGNQLIDVATGNGSLVPFQGVFALRSHTLFAITVESGDYKWEAVPLANPAQAVQIHHWHDDRANSAIRPSIHDLFFFVDDVAWGWNGSRWIPIDWRTD